MRYLLRIGERPAAATAVLRAVRSRCEFWADDLSYADADLAHVRGHRQVADAYLASLAGRAGARLATLDEGLAQALPEVVTLLPPRAAGPGAGSRG